MKIEKNSPIVQRLKEKKKLLAKDNPEHEKIRTTLIVAGGVMKGVFSGGCLVGLEELRFGSVFDVVVGISAGAANLAYFLSGQGAEGISIYYRDMNDRRFFNWLRLLKFKAMDVGYVEDTLRYGRRKLDVGALRNSRSQFHVGVTCLNGQAQLKNVKEAKDVITTIKASMTPPVLAFYRTPVLLDGERFVDGGMSLPLPVEETIKLFRPTDLLVILNRPCNFREKDPSMIEELIFFLTRPIIPRSCFGESRKEYNRSLDLVMESMNVGVICPEDDDIKMFERKAKKLEQCARSGAEAVKQLFS